MARAFDPARVVAFSEVLASVAEEMGVRFAQNSRRYAKRQVTWFTRDPRIRWIPMDENRDPVAVAEEIARGWNA